MAAGFGAGNVRLLVAGGTSRRARRAIAGLGTAVFTVALATACGSGGEEPVAVQVTVRSVTCPAGAPQCTTQPLTGAEIRIDGPDVSTTVRSSSDGTAEATVTGTGDYSVTLTVPGGDPPRVIESGFSVSGGDDRVSLSFDVDDR